MAFLCVEYRVVLGDLNDLCERHFLPEAPSRQNRTPFLCFCQTSIRIPLLTHSLSFYCCYYYRRTEAWWHGNRTK
jgi:hypothetical protein